LLTLDPGMFRRAAASWLKLPCRPCMAGTAIGKFLRCISNLYDGSAAPGICVLAPVCQLNKP